MLLVDEAQTIPDDSLEALRLLTNLETEKAKLLQIVLFGQPELNVRLEQPKIRQLKQRIIFNYQLRPLNLEEVNVYVQHWVAVSAGQLMTLFDRKAIKLLHKASRGIPRLIKHSGSQGPDGRIRPG